MCCEGGPLVLLDQVPAEHLPILRPAQHVRIIGAEAAPQLVSLQKVIGEGASRGEL